MQTLGEIKVFPQKNQMIVGYSLPELGNRDFFLSFQQIYRFSTFFLLNIEFSIYRRMGKTTPFFIRDCNLSLIATGEIAESLVELKALLRRIDDSSLYYHFWGGRLRISFVHPEYHNDFARWAHFALHDDVLTERLAIIDPTEFRDLNDLRKKVIDVIEERLEEMGSLFWYRKEYKFHFLRSILIIFNTGIKITAPSDLKEIIPKLTFTSIFYHFIEARRRTEDGNDDFSCWLLGFGEIHQELIKKIKLIDPYFLSLSEIRKKLEKLFQDHL